MDGYQRFKSDNLSRPSASQAQPALLEKTLTVSQMDRFVKDNIVKQLYYGDFQFMERHDEQKSSEFFQQITYQVDLSQLYKIVDTCYYNQKMPYCPILVEKTQESTNQNRKYLLQVWNSDSNMVYQKALQSKPVASFITYDTFVFKPDRADQETNEDCFYVVYLYKDNATVKVNVAGVMGLDQINHPIIGFCNKCLYISTENQIFILNIQMKVDKGSLHQFDDYSNNQRQPFCIDLGKVKNHAFLVNEYEYKDAFLIICCETSDNQIDFSMLFFFISQDNFLASQYQIKQIQEVVKRDLAADPIVQFKAIFNKEWPYAISMRSSGRVDFYWNYLRIGKADRSVILQDRHTDIDLNFEALYAKDIKGQIKQIKLEWQGRIGLEVAEILPSDNLLPFEKLFQQKINSKVNFYHTSCLISTSFIVAHHKKIFIYDVVLKQWIKRFKCTQRIMRVFRNEMRPGLYNVGILLENGQFDMIENRDYENFNPQEWKLNNNIGQQINGVPHYIAPDLEHYRMLYILSKVDETYQLQYFTRGIIHKFEMEHQMRLGGQNTYIFPLFSPNNDSMFIVYNQMFREQYGQILIMHCKHKLKQNNEESITTKLVRTIQFNDEEIVNEQDIPHVALSSNIDDQIAFIGKKNVYKISITHQTVEVIKDTNIMSVQMIDENYCYAIVNNSQNISQSGLKLFSMEMLLKSQQKCIFMYDVDKTIAGTNSFIDFGEDNQRLTYLKNYETAHIIPPLHRTTINFMGMLPREKYLAVKREQNKFYALDRHNQISTWNILTGKLLSQKTLGKTHDYSGYEVFGREKQEIDYIREWNKGRTLLISLKEKVGIFNQKFFDESNLSCEIIDCKPYVYTDTIRYHTFKLIEIIDEDKVIEHVSFVHHYHTKYQRLFISDDCQILIEKLINLRVLIYKRVNSNEIDDEWKWQLEKRFLDFPHEMSKISESLFLFSPDFQRYLNFDKVKGCFFIKHTLRDGSIKVPKSLMDPNKSEDVTSIIKRFAWVDNENIIVSSEWGLEKLLKVDCAKKTLCEITSSHIPALFQIKKQQHFYKEHLSLSLGQSQERLIRKYQELKRQRFIFEKYSSIQIYNVLFSIDYNVDKGKYKYVSDLSFSHMQWKLIEDIQAGKIDIKMIDEAILRSLCLNILPGCKTILHLLWNQSSMITKIFDTVPIYNEAIEFEMPFIQDIYMKTPLHYCTQKFDYKTADIFIKYLANAPLDHHSRAIVDIIPQLIEKGLPSLLTYFDSRLITTDQIGKIQRGAIKRYSENLEVGIFPTSMWVDLAVMKKELFEADGQDGSKPIQGDIELKFIDLPEYHFYNSQHCEAFFKALKETQQQELFELQSIRILIDYMWPLAKSYTYRMLLIPFICYLISYWTYTNILYEMKSDFSYGVQAWLVGLVTIVLFSLYFLKNELKQIASQKWEYFLDPWNYIDFIPPLIILSIALINLISDESLRDYEKTIQAIGSLLMWLKLLYFFRVNKYTGYMIRMIVKVIFGMKTFLRVLLITIVAFGDAFVSLKLNNDPLGYPQNGSVMEYIWHAFKRFIGNCFFTYEMILGQLEIDSFDDTQMFVASLLVVFCTLFVMIVMLNLLIAIIGDIFNRVQENQINEFYQEKASIIAENSYLIPDEIKTRNFKQGQLLLIGRKLGENIETDEIEDDTTKEQRQMQSQLNQIMTLMQARFQNIEQQIDSISHGARNNRRSQNL